MSNTKTIVKNTGWFGIETLLNIIVGTVTSIAVARALGPTRMGYIIYVSWIATIASNLGGVGIPVTVRKYMAEYLGRGDRSTARLVYIRTLWLQTALAGLVTCGVCVWVLQDSSSEYRLASLLIALSIWPSMINFVSAQANTATETLSANLPASFASMLVYFATIVATIVFHWGVLGFGASVLLMRVIDCTVRLVPTARRILAWERGASYPDGIERRMMSFAFQTLTSTLVSLIVWDRSEFVLLKHLCKDIRQLAFYSVAFNLADRLLLGATVFGTAIAATMFAQYGRDKSQLPRLTSSAFRYLALISIPLHAIATALIAPLMLLLYGRQYSDAALVVTIAPLLCLPKAFMTPIQSLFQSFERQSLVILVTLVAGVADLSTAWLLISRHGAIGACIGSGVGQFSAIALLWGIAINWFGLRLPWSFLAKVAASSGAAFAAAYFIAANLPPLFGVSLGAAGACAVFLLGLYLLRALQNEDLSRFWMTACKLPAVVSRPLYRLMQILVRSPQSLVVPEQVA